MFELINYHHEIAALRAYAGKSGLQMKLMESSGNDKLVAFTDGKCLYVPMPKADWEAADWVRWKFQCYHEAGHNKAPCDDLFNYMDTEKMEMSPYTFFLNILDDYRQEHVHTGEYAGRDAAVSIGRAVASLESIALLKETMGKLPDSNESEEINSALFIFTDRQRPSFQPDTKGIGELQYDMANDKIKAWADKLEAYAEEFNNTLTAKGEAAFLDKILKEVFEWDDDQIQQAKQSTSGGSEKGEGDAEGNESAQGAEKDSSSDSEDAKTEGVMHWKDIIPHNHNEDKPSFGDLTILFDDYHYSGSNEGANPEPKVISGDKRHNARVVSIHPATALTNRLRKLLRVKSQKKYVGHQDKGKLSARDLYRIAKDDDDFAIFKKKTSEITLDTAVSILLDMSGSMGGDKWNRAVNACYQLYMGLTKLRVPLEIIGFKSGSTDTFVIFKGFNEKVGEEKFKQRLLNHGPGESNEDGAAILFTAGRLIRRREPGKLLIVISDGQPAGYNRDSMGFAIKVVRKIEKASPINILGIGIKDKTVERIYKEWVVIKDARELEEALLGVIKRKLLKRK